MGKVVKLKTPEFNAIAAQKLSSSGLSEEQASALGMYSIANAATLTEQFEAEPALVLPYYGLDGKPLRAHPEWPDFYRIRYLGEPKHDFLAASGVKQSRYSQPKDTGVCAYFANCLDWKALAKDPTEPLLITEGELKAAKACIEGFPTIGLGGVYNFRQASHGVFFLPELEQFDWRRRKVTVVYDSDFQTNAMVCSAIHALADELAERGALVYVATLPDVYEEEARKTGLDDFLVERSEEELIEVLLKADPLGITRRLWEMNREIAYVRDPGMVVVLKNGLKLDCGKFTAHSDWATISVPEAKLDKNGKTTYTKASAAPVWIKWPLRNAVDKLSYLPGKERFVEVNGTSYLNQWRGWGTAPKKGSVKPFLELIDFLFKDADKGAKEWFLDWCAYPIVHPGTKLFSAVIMHGRMTGTGKTLIGYSLARIYGDNFIKIKNEDLANTWWAENRQFVLGDEVSGTDKRSEADAMKAMITQEEININIKFIPQFSIPDCVNYYLTSNHCDALFLEDEDRRFFVHQVVARSPLPLSFYQEYDKWLNHGDGPANLMHWLLQRDVSNFNPKGPAFRTSARERMILSGKSDLALWCHELRENPDSKLWVGKMRHVRDLYTSAELLGFYERDHPSSVGKVTTNGMARALTGAGFEQAYDNKPILLRTDGDKSKQARFFIVRNEDRWRNVKDGKALSRHVSLEPVRD